MTGGRRQQPNDRFGGNPRCYDTSEGRLGKSTMLKAVKDLRGYAIGAADGEIGTVEDFYFDDLEWKIRFFVVRTGTWLFGRRVLLSPVFIGHADVERQSIATSLTREEVKSSPDVDTSKPVSRQRAAEMAPYLGWPPYGLVGESMFAPPVLPDPQPNAKGDPNLRSAEEVWGYHLRANDGDIGKITGFISDESSWDIRFVVVDTGKWLNRNQVLIAPRWIATISWAERTVTVNLDSQSIRSSPEFDPTLPIPPDYAAKLHAHYGKEDFPRSAPTTPVRLSRIETKALYDKISGVYDFLSDRSEGPIRENALDRFGAKSGEAILEVGFGTGHCLAALAKSIGPAGRVYGIDLSDGMLGEAKKALAGESVLDRVELRRGDAVALPYGDASMDGIFMSFTLELFDDAEIPTVLAECRRVLKPGGRVVIAAMSNEGEHGLMYEAYQWTHRHFPNFVDCRPISVRKILEGAGFKVCSSDKMSIWVPVEVVLAMK